MDSGALLESPEGSKSSSPMGACTCTFLQRGSSSVTLPISWIRGSVAFPRGFPTRLPTGLSHVPPWWESILSVNVLAVQGKQSPLEWTDTSGGSLGMVAGCWSSSHLSCGERLLLRCDGNPGNSFPRKHGTDPSSRATRRKRGSSGCGRDPRASSRVETGMSGNFLSCSKGVKPFGSSSG